jgi:hypothetical protein
LASFFGIAPDQVEVTVLAGRRLLSGNVGLSVTIWVYSADEAEALAVIAVTQTTAFNDFIRFEGLPPVQYVPGSMMIDSPPPQNPETTTARPRTPSPDTDEEPGIFPGPLFSSAPRARARGHHALACLLVGVLLNR